VGWQRDMSPSAGGGTPHIWPFAAAVNAPMLLQPIAWVAQVPTWAAGGEAQLRKWADVVESKCP